LTKHPGYSPRRKNIGVFLDQGIAGHAADFVYHKEKPRVTFDDYYQQVGSFINRLMIEQGLDGFELLLHPSNFAPVSDVRAAINIEKCDVSKGDTPAAIHDAALVVGENSSAFSLAVLFQKPVCFFYATSTFLDNPINFTDPEITADYARLLGRTVNRSDSGELDCGIDYKAYDRFRRRYIKEIDTPDLSYFEILGQELKKVNLS
jgi:hypothetical protein